MTRKDSVALAKKLKDLSPAIQGIELFGSVLINGSGRDADFLVLVDKELAQRWWSEERESIRVRWPDQLYEQRWIVKKFMPFAYSATVHRRRRRRLEVSASMLGIELGRLAGPDGRVPDFEMFLVPPAWRAGKEVNMDAMRQVTNLVDDRNTLGFLRRIAKDAVGVA